MTRNPYGRGEARGPVVDLATLLGIGRRARRPRPPCDLCASGTRPAAQAAGSPRQCPRCGRPLPAEGGG